MPESRLIITLRASHRQHIIYKLAAIYYLNTPIYALSSYAGYSAAQAKITLPISGDVVGINVDGEGAYNYLGIYSQSGYEQGGYTEAGLFTAKDGTYYAPNTWYAYTAGGYYIAPNGTKRTGVVAHRDFAYGEPQGVSPGKTVKIDTRLLSQRNSIDGIEYYVSNNFSIPGTTYNKNYIRRAGIGSYSNFYVGRTTSYLANTWQSFDGSKNNYWFEVSIGKFTLWDVMSQQGQYAFEPWTKERTSSGYPYVGNDRSPCLARFSVDSAGDGYTTDIISISYF